MVNLPKLMFIKSLFLKYLFIMTSLTFPQLLISIILPAILHGYETWSLTLREEHRLRAFENKVLRKIFEAKRD